MTESTASIRVLLAEDSYVVREGVRALIDTQDGLELVGICADLAELLSAVDELTPDVVLTDIRMPPTQTDEGVRAAQWMRRNHPDIGVVMLSQYVEADYAIRLFEDGSGGRAYLLKERVGDVEDLVDAITQVHRGGSVVDRAVVDALITARSREHSPVDDLTARMTMPVPGWRLGTSLAASMPSRPNVGGIRMSVTTTWGRWPRLRPPVPRNLRPYQGPRSRPPSPAGRARPRAR